MTKMYFQTPRCTYCGGDATITFSRDGHTIHRCLSEACVKTHEEVTRNSRLREKDSKMLRQLGLIV